MYLFTLHAFVKTDTWIRLDVNAKLVKTITGFLECCSIKLGKGPKLSKSMICRIICGTFDRCTGGVGLHKVLVWYGRGLKLSCLIAVAFPSSRKMLH